MLDLQCIKHIDFVSWVDLQCVKHKNVNCQKCSPVRTTKKKNLIYIYIYILRPV